MTLNFDFDTLHIEDLINETAFPELYELWEDLKKTDELTQIQIDRITGIFKPKTSKLEASKIVSREFTKLVQDMLKTTGFLFADRLPKENKSLVRDFRVRWAEWIRINLFDNAHFDIDGKIISSVIFERVKHVEQQTSKRNENNTNQIEKTNTKTSKRVIKNIKNVELFSFSENHSKRRRTELATKYPQLTEAELDDIILMEKS